MGFLATNTISQGDTRESGLSWIREHEGDIYNVTRRIEWPGRANVTISRVHVSKGKVITPAILSGKPVDQISAFLFHGGSDRNPNALVRRVCIAGKGIVPWGMGFVFEDGKEGCPSIADMNAVVAADPSCATRIHRFIGGADLNALPNLMPNRFIADLDGLSEHEAGQWPGLMRILERFVKPVRMALPDTSSNRRLRERWWHFSQGREMREATSGLTRVLLTAQTSKYRSFAFVNGSWIFDQVAVGFACSDISFFAVMQSRIHELWSDFFSRTLEDRPVYSPPRCFDTFPFPERWRNNPNIEAAGENYYEFRAALMMRNEEGMTKTYNRFHDPDARDQEILKLRELHASLDKAVLDAYDWRDIPTDCEFLLDYEIDEEEWGDRTKPYRYRWPDEVQAEVLARLLELNAARTAEETRSGAAAAGIKGGRKRTARPKAAAPDTKGLFS